MYTLAQQLKDEGRKEGRKEGKKEGIREGIEKGKREGIRETARRMLLNNFSIEQVIAVTGLSGKEIRKLMS